MLIDLTFSLKPNHYNRATLKEFDTSNNGLRIVLDIPNHSILDHQYAVKLDSLGCYSAWSFEYIIEDFTEYEVINGFEEGQKLFKAIEKAMSDGDKDKENKARDLFWEHCNNSEYGVADSLEQVLEYGKKFIESEHPYVISFSLIKSEDQPDEGGWRWHKWGPYIGQHSVTHEYLKDQPEIKEVIIFHFHKLKLKDKKIDNLNV